MKSGLKELAAPSPTGGQDVATYAAMKSGLKALKNPLRQRRRYCSNLCRDEKRTESDDWTLTFFVRYW